MKPTIQPDAYICDKCEALVTVDDAEECSPLYECGECGSRYNRDNSADGESHRCPDCGKFGAKVADKCCPECEDGELSPLVRA